MVAGYHFDFFDIFKTIIMYTPYLDISHWLENPFKIIGIKPLKKETLAQVFSCEFSEISKNTFFTEHLWSTASVYS